MFDVAPGKEEEFRYLKRSLALSDRLDRLIEVTEPQGRTEPVSPPAAAPVTPASAAGVRPRGLRAGFASRLARIALTLHRDAATDAGLQPEAESPR